MRSLLFPAALILRIALGLTQNSPSDDFNAPAPSAITCQLVPTLCFQKYECLDDLPSSYPQTGCSRMLSECWAIIPKCRSDARMTKRSLISRNSYLFMKLHPVLHRATAGDPNASNVPTRYRRLGARLGSEFLGKRSGTEDDARRRRAPTELLGKRWGSEMLGKRNVEMLGRKRGVEFLGKRGNEFLGKRTDGTRRIGAECYLDSRILRYVEGRKRFLTRNEDRSNGIGFETEENENFDNIMDRL